METSAAKAFLGSVLASSSSLITALGGTAIYADVIPQGSALPAIVYSVQSGLLEGNARGDAIAGVPLMTVKVITQGYGVATADSIMEIVKPLLEGVRGTVTGYYILGCSRVGAVDYPEIEQGVLYRHLGGIYRIAVVGTA